MAFFSFDIVNVLFCFSTFLNNQVCDRGKKVQISINLNANGYLIIFNMILNFYHKYLLYIKFAIQSQVTNFILFSIFRRDYNTVNLKKTKVIKLYTIKTIWKSDQ